MKAVLISIQPYYVFLIIARRMGWDIPKEKTVEVRKDFPKDPAWNKHVHIYCSKNRKSFNRIPEQYQPFMAKLLGKVIGEFVCDKVDINYPILIPNTDIALYNDEWVLGSRTEDACLSLKEIAEYGKGKPVYGWHISELKIYDKPKELGEFHRNDCFCDDCRHIVLPRDRNPLSECDRFCDKYKEDLSFYDGFNRCEKCREDDKITRPPQSWCYCESLEE